MRWFVFVLIMLSCMVAFPQKATDGAMVAQAVLADVARDGLDPVMEKGDGLYAYKGVDTRHGLQCVEYAERFYVTLYPGTFPYHNSGPGAYDIWEGIANQKNVGAWRTHRQYFIAYENGATVPQADDMLVYDRSRGGGYGHVAIVAAVYPQAVEILEQNRDWETKRLLPRIGDVIIDRGVKGVVRLRVSVHGSSSR